MPVVGLEDTVAVIVVECCTMSFRPVKASRSAQIEKAEWSNGGSIVSVSATLGEASCGCLSKSPFEQLFTIASILLGVGRLFVWEGSAVAKTGTAGSHWIIQASKKLCKDAEECHKEIHQVLHFTHMRPLESIRGLIWRLTIR